MKTFKQFTEKTWGVAVLKKKPKGPSTTPAQDRLKDQHSRERDSLADRNKADKARSSDEFQQMTSMQKGEIKRARRSDKSSAKRRADKAKKEKKAGGKPK